MPKTNDSKPVDVASGFDNAKKSEGDPDTTYHSNGQVASRVINKGRSNEMLFTYDRNGKSTGYGFI